MLQGQMANEWIVNSCTSKTRHCWTQCQDKTTKMHFANIKMGNFIWGRVYGLGKIGRGKVYDSLQEYSPLRVDLKLLFDIPAMCSVMQFSTWLKFLQLLASDAKHRRMQKFRASSWTLFLCLSKIKISCCSKYDRLALALENESCLLL